MGFLLFLLVFLILIHSAIQAHCYPMNDFWYLLFADLLLYLLYFQAGVFCISLRDAFQVALGRDHY